MKKLRYGMVGGGPGSFIGDAHRRAINLDGQAELVAGCFSRTPEKCRETGAQLGIAPDRVEGYRSDSWVVLDYETVVVHIFTSEARSFYDLDRLWLDGEKLNMTFEPN